MSRNTLHICNYWPMHKDPEGISKNLDICEAFKSFWVRFLRENIYLEVYISHLYIWLKNNTALVIIFYIRRTNLHWILSFLPRDVAGVFHKCIKLTIMPLLPTLYSHMVSFLLYLQHMILINMKLHFDGFNRITFQVCSLHWSDSLLIAQLKNPADIYRFPTVHTCR